MSKITLYSESGGSIEIDDTPRKRQWAKGKGYTLEAPPGEMEPMDEHVAYPEPGPDYADEAYED